jgi:hypothetical protein
VFQASKRLLNGYRQLQELLSTGLQITSWLPNRLQEVRYRLLHELEIHIGELRYVVQRFPNRHLVI